MTNFFGRNFFSIRKVSRKINQDYSGRKFGDFCTQKFDQKLLIRNIKKIIRGQTFSEKFNAENLKIKKVRKNSKNF